MAETTALRAVAFIVADEAARAGLLRMTGIGPDNLRHGLDDPAVLAGVLEFLLANEPRLLSFCRENGLDPRLPAAAHRRLTRGEGLSDPDL
ncbi:MAG: DUF3572 family protein [Alphaproteobacteria bacterium]|nr:MAG: DUF3572 family protein [Alphaproteobacteria bacterium]